MDYNKLRLAISAGARGISTNKKLSGSTYCEFPKGEIGKMQEISYYHAQMILLFLSDCISDDGVDFDTLADRIDNIDKYEIKEN